jgi:hypothetical protein
LHSSPCIYASLHFKPCSAFTSLQHSHGLYTPLLLCCIAFNTVHHTVTAFIRILRACTIVHCVSTFTASTTMSKALLAFSWPLQVLSRSLKHANSLYYNALLVSASTLSAYTSIFTYSSLKAHSRPLNAFSLPLKAL